MESHNLGEEDLTSAKRTYPQSTSPVNKGVPAYDHGRTGGNQTTTVTQIVAELQCNATAPVINPYTSTTTRGGDEN
eukprot:6188964-Ditylum_brightwellii.AAC.1